MLHVLHVIKGLGPGGAEQLLVNTARVVDDDQIDYRVAYLVPEKDHLVPSLETAQWPATCLGSGRSWDLRWLWSLRRLLVSEQIDVVHGHSPQTSALTRLVLRTIRHRPASVYTEHNEWGRHRGPTRRLNAATLRLEGRVLAVSEAVRRSMKTSVPVEVVIHGIDTEAVAAQSAHRAVVRDELGVDRDDPDAVVIGIVANHRREKAYDVLIAAAAEVLDDPGVRFVSVGQGPLEAEHRELGDRLEHGDRFQFLGYRPDATRIMSGFDVFTLSSHHEGLPVSMMDALALGLPVVATSVGGIPDALAGRGDAEVVAPGDPVALAAALRDMIERVRAARRGEAELVPAGADDFDARATAEVLAAHYRAVSGR